MKRAGPDGFTLLELSVVLLIIAIVTGMAVQSGISVVATARLTATQNKISAIESALMAYRNINDRLPCPASLTIAANTANYGIEAANPGTCSGGTPTANFSAAGVTNTGATGVEGAVPTVTLGLPNDFMYDGWGNRIRYAVDIDMTTAGAFSGQGLGCGAQGAITVKDGNGNSRSTGAIYALISQGPNAHGAYSQTGTIYNAGVSSAHELINCHCTNSGVAGTYAPTYVQKFPAYDSGHSADAAYYFDDVVTYKERWQLASDLDTLNAGCLPQYLAVSGSANYPTLFYVNRGTVTQLPPPATHSTWNWNDSSVDFTPDNKTLAWSGSMLNSECCGPALTTAGILYSVAPTGLTYSANNIAAHESDTRLRISPDGTYMAVAGCTDTGSGTCINPYIRLYNRDSSPQFSTVTSSRSTSGWAFHWMAWSPDGNTLYGADYANGGQGGSCGVDVYTRSGGTITYSATLSTASAMTNNDLGWTTTVAVHPSGNYLAMGGAGGGAYGPYVIKNPLSNPSKISVAGSGLAIGSSPGVAFSPDGNFLAATPNGNSVAVYAFNPANAPAYFTARTVSGNSCTGSGVVAFSQDSRYLAFVAGSGTCVFKRNGSGTLWTQIFTSNVGGGDVVWSK